MSATEKLRLEVILAAVDKVTGPLKTITKGSGDAARALRAAKDQLKDIQGQQKAIAAFKDADKAAAITANAFKGVQEQVKHLQREMAKTPEPTRAMIKALKDAQAESDALKNRHAGLMDRQQRLFAQMKAGGIDTRNLANHSRDLSTRQIEAARSVDKLKQSLEAQNKVLSRAHAANATLQRYAMRGAAVGAVGAAVSAPGVKFLKDFAARETAETMLRTSMMDASGKIDESFDKIKKKADELGSALPGATRNFLDAARELKQQGMSSSSIVGGGLQASAYLGVRFKMDQARAAEFIAKAREAHGLKDEDLPNAADYMHRAREAFGLRQDSIYEAMKYAATDLNLKGQVGDMRKMKEYLVVQGVAGQAGLEGSTFGTNFSHMMKQMAAISRDAKSMKGALGDYVSDTLGAKGIKFDFYDKQGNFGGYERMFTELEKLKSLSPVDQELVLKKLFDTEGARVAGLMLKLGLQGFKANIAQMEGVASLTMVTEEMKKTLEYQQENFSGNIENLSADLGAHLKPKAAATLEVLNGLIEKLRDFNREHPMIASGIITTVAGLGGLLVAASAIILPLGAINWALMMLGTSLGATAAAAWVIVSPFAKIAAAFAIGYAAGSGFNFLIDLLVSKMLGHKTTLGAALFDLVETIKLKFGEMAGWLVTLPGRFMAAGAAIVDGIMSGINSRWEALKSLVTGLGDSTVAWLKDRLGIRSPSTVFAQIGAYTMAGLEQGIEAARMGPLSAILNAARLLTAAGAGIVISGTAAGALPAIDTRLPLAAAGQMGTGSGPSHNFNFYINAAPGMDERALAQAVRREFASFESARSAQRRSRLSDLE